MTTDFKSTTITFRDAARTEDIESIRRLVGATGFFSEAEVLIAVELVQERLEKGPTSGYEFLFASEPQQVGDESFEQVLGYSCYGEIPCTAGSYDIYWIVVDPAQQRRGIGQELMLRTERKVAELGGRRLYIDTSGKMQYLPTRKFYERCGYTIAAELPDFYAENDAKVIYSKQTMS